MWETVEVEYTFLGDCCWEVQMRKMGFIMMGVIVIVSCIQKKNWVVLSHICNFFGKSYKWLWDLKSLAQFQGSEIFPGLLQDFMDWYIKFLRLPPLLVQLLFSIKGTLT